MSKYWSSYWLLHLTLCAASDSCWLPQILMFLSSSTTGGREKNVNLSKPKYGWCCGSLALFILNPTNVLLFIVSEFFVCPGFWNFGWQPTCYARTTQWQLTTDHYPPNRDPQCVIMKRKRIIQNQVGVTNSTQHLRTQNQDVVKIAAAGLQ